jgi:hypothetical protein
VSATSLDVASLALKGYTLNVSGPMTIAGDLTLTTPLATGPNVPDAHLTVSGPATVGGALLVQSSSLEAAASLAISGSVTAQDGSLTVGTSLNAGGDVALDGANLALASASIAGNLSANGAISPSTISVSNSLNISGTTSLYETSVTGKGVIQLQGKLTTGAYVTPVPFAVPESFSGVTLEVMSSAEQLPNDGLQLLSGSRVVNKPPATYHMDNPSSILGDSSSTFENDGSLLADSGSTAFTTTSIGSLFNQSSTGSLTVTSGIMYLEGGVPFAVGEIPANALALAGTLIADSGATIAIGTPGDASPLSVNVPTTVTLEGRGSVAIYNVALNVPGQVSAAAPLSIGRTTITGAGAVTSNTSLTLGSSSQVGQTFVDGSTIVNNGTATLATGSPSTGLHFENGAHFDNAAGGVFTFLTDATISADFPSDGLFTNEGTVNKSAGATGLSTFLLNVVNKGAISLTSGSGFDVAGTLDNAGTISLSPGKLTVIMPFKQEPTGVLDVAITRPTPATGYGQIVAPGLPQLGGTLNVSLAPGYLPAGGTSFQVISSFSVSGSFAAVNGLTTPGGTQLTLVASSNGLALQVPKSTPSKPTRVSVSGITGVADSAAGVTAITMNYNVPVNARSATKKSFYSLIGAVTKKQRMHFTRSLAIKRVVLASPSSVTVVLAQPYHGAVKISIRSGVLAANGTKSSRSFSAVAQ